ncbi:LytR/AlgR family response regulator transcription factor [Roseisolibacter agri]|nr:LytTR family DNA-binding domain-containing protein [Roseisolibacter agri]
MSAPLRAMIVDDEPIARRGIQQLLARDAEVELVGEAGSGVEAVAEIRRLRPEILILDVQMPDLDGFGVLRELGSDPLPAVIFVTAFDQHAVRAFEVHALDYVLKPFDDARFESAVRRAKREAYRAREGDLVDRLASLLGRGAGGERRPYADRIVLRSGARVSFVDADEILFVRASGNYVEVRTRKHLHVLRETLAEMAVKLDPATFVRIHRSTIINAKAVQHAESVYRGEYVVTMQDGTKFPSSRSYREQLEKALRIG